MTSRVQLNNSAKQVKSRKEKLLLIVNYIKQSIKKFGRENCYALFLKQSAFLLFP